MDALGVFGHSTPNVEGVVHECCVVHRASIANGSLKTYGPPPRMRVPSSILSIAATRSDDGDCNMSQGRRGRRTQALETLEANQATSPAGHVLCRKASTSRRTLP